MKLIMPRVLEVVVEVTLDFSVFIENNYIKSLRSINNIPKKHQLTPLAL